MRLLDTVATLMHQRSLARPPQWFLDAVSPGKSLSGVSVTETTALNSAAVWAACNALANPVAILPRHVYKRIEGTGRERAIEHPAYTAINSRPNDDMTAFAFFHSSMLDLLLNGNAYAYITKAGNGKDHRLWRLPASKITPKRYQESIFYEYREDNGATMLLPADKIVHVPGIGYDGLVGRSVIQHARESIGSAIAAEKHAGAVMGNNAMPPVFLKHPGASKPEARENLRKSMEKLHKGVEKAGTFGILEEGLDVSTIQINHRDLQFLETRQFSVTEIARWFNVPPHKIQDLSRATYSNITEQETMFITDSVLPWIKRFEEVLSMRLIGTPWPRVYYIEWSIAARLRGTTKERFESYRIGRDGGWLSVNEIREMENMNRIEGGDEYLSPLNMRPADQPAAQTDADEDAGDSPPDDSAQLGRMRRAIVEAFVGTLADPLSRMLRKEQRAASRTGLKRDDFAGWLDEFYEDQEKYVRAAVGPVIDAFCIAIHGTIDLNDPPDTLAELAGDLAQQIAERHVATSRMQMEAGSDPANAWPANRAESDARSELDAALAAILSHESAAGVLK